MIKIDYEEPFQVPDWSLYALKDLRGWLYVVENLAFPGYVKVGRTTDLPKRLGGYNKDQPWISARVIRVTECFVNSVSVEGKVLKHLYAHTSPTTFRNEWFEKKDLDLIDRVLEAAEKEFPLVPK